MKNAPTTLERKLHAKGFQMIAGVDEVGRGAWAGPITAAAVIMPIQPQLQGVRDSKKVSKKKRPELALAIHDRAIGVGIGYVDAPEIDEMGIGPANELVIRRALKALEPQIDYILIDAFTIDNLPAPSQSIIRGDASVYCIAAASICAKVHRDALMKKYAEEFPEYGFDGHVGYGTAVHRKAIETHGLTVIHRRSFQPMAGMI